MVNVTIADDSDGLKSAVWVAHEASSIVFKDAHKSVIYQVAKNFKSDAKASFWFDKELDLYG